MKRKLNKGTGLLIIFPEAQMDLFFQLGRMRWTIQGQVYGLHLHSPCKTAFYNERFEKLRRR